MSNFYGSSYLTLNELNIPCLHYSKYSKTCYLQFKQKNIPLVDSAHLYLQKKKKKRKGKNTLQAEWYHIFCHISQRVPYQYIHENHANLSSAWTHTHKVKRTVRFTGNFHGANEIGLCCRMRFVCIVSAAVASIIRD